MFQPTLKFTVSACVLALGLAGAALAQQPYPNKPIQLVIPFAAGGAADVLGRMWGDFVGRSMGTPVIVDNRSGANGSIGAAYAAKQPADGYTVFYGGISTMVLNKHSYKQLAYNPAKDFEPITLLANAPLVLVANPAKGMRNLNDLIQQAKREPGKLSFGSAGKGNSTHLFVELLADNYGVSMLHVPYKGMAPATNDLLGGQIDFAADVATSQVGNAQGGRVTPLVLFSSRRWPQFPNVPTITEAGVKDFPISGWYGLAVPTGTPKAIIERLDKETRKFWADPAVKAKLETIMLEPVPLGAAAYSSAMADADRVWGPLIRKLNIVNE